MVCLKFAGEDGETIINIFLGALVPDVFCPLFSLCDFVPSPDYDDEEEEERDFLQQRILA